MEHFFPRPCGCDPANLLTPNSCSENDVVQADQTRSHYDAGGQWNERNRNSRIRQLLEAIGDMLRSKSPRKYRKSSVAFHNSKDCRI